MIKKFGIAAVAALAVIFAAYAQQGGSGRPGGATNSTQYRVNATTFGGAGPGNAGEVLTSNGAAMPPTFQAAAGGGCAPAGNAGEVLYDDGAGGCDNETAFVYDAGTNTLTVPTVVGTTAWTGTPSSFIASNATFPAYQLLDTNAAANRGRWIWTIDSGGSLEIHALDDTGSSGGFFAEVTRGNNTAANANFATTAQFNVDVNGGTDEVNITSGLVTFPGNVTVSGTCTGCGSGVTQSTGTFVGNYDNACTTTPTLTVNYTLTGNVVNLSLPAMANCTSDSNSFSGTAGDMPAEIRPTSSPKLVGIAAGTDNGTAIGSCLIVTSAGALSFTPATSGACALGTAWTASGTKNGNTRISSASYTLD